MQNLGKSFRVTLIYLIPFIWFVIFLLIPILFIIAISFTIPVNSTPPVTSILDYQNNTLHLTLYLKNYIELIHFNIILIALFNSIKVALITTLLCILIGYPMALALSRAKQKVQVLNDLPKNRH